MAFRREKRSFRLIYDNDGINMYVTASLVNGYLSIEAMESESGPNAEALFNREEAETLRDFLTEILPEIKEETPPELLDVKET